MMDREALAYHRHMREVSREAKAMSERVEIDEGVPLDCPRCKKRTGELGLLRRFCQNCGIELPTQEPAPQEPKALEAE